MNTCVISMFPPMALALWVGRFLGIFARFLGDFSIFAHLWANFKNSPGASGEFFKNRPHVGEFSKGDFQEGEFSEGDFQQGDF